MENILTFGLVNYLSSYSAELLSLLQFFTGTIILLIMFHYASLSGIFVYSAIATILANIQALKLADFTFFNHPVALGTTIFAAIYICDDIINEHYGKKSARLNILLCFLSQIFVSSMMLEALAFKTADNNYTDEAFQIIFMPGVRILIASIISFVISQNLNVSIFSKLSEKYNKKKLWLRVILSFACSTLVDNIIFSSLAWVLFAAKPVSLAMLINTYILPSYLLQLIFSVFSLPIVYFSVLIKPKTNV